MSGNESPRRRRIAGESGHTAPAARKVPSARKRPAATKAPVAQPSVTKEPPVVKKPALAEQPFAEVPLRPPLAVLGVAALAAVAVVVGLVLCVMALFGSSDGARSDSDVRAATSAAGAAAETIFSFTYDDLDSHLADSKALMTAGFSEEFDKVAPSLTELAPQRKVQVQAVARETAAVECGDECSADTVTALVFVDQVRLVGGDDEPTVFANRIEVTMKHTDGRWLVDDIRAL